MFFGMLKSKKIRVGKKVIQALAMNLAGRNLILLRGSRGYVMCGYLNLAAANKFRDIAVKIVGVNTIEEAIKTKAHSASRAALKIGIYKGQPIKDTLRAIA
jgi:uncharacterized protein YunC (DUF1805 family)